MKTTTFLTAAVCSLSLLSCVSTKKFHSMESDYKKSQADANNCQDMLLKAQALSNDLAKDKNVLQAQIDYLKKNSTQVLSALQDMSVLSGKQAESVKQSLQTLSEKDSYIRNLQSAIARKDSLNMALVMNLKGAVGDINDKDINIKVEKGVVYVDISDKLLFNSGKYAVTENARKILGKVAKVLEAYPDLEFMVEGHTDNVPISTGCLEDNWDLSVKRSTSVIRILENQYHISPERMTAAGHGKFLPVASNDNAEGRALNRRTRIVILPQLDQFFKLLVKK